MRPGPGRLGFGLGGNQGGGWGTWKLVGNNKCSLSLANGLELLGNNKCPLSLANGLELVGNNKFSLILAIS